MSKISSTGESHRNLPARHFSIGDLRFDIKPVKLVSTFLEVSRRIIHYRITGNSLPCCGLQAAPTELALRGSMMALNNILTGREQWCRGCRCDLEGRVGGSECRSAHLTYLSPVSFYAAKVSRLLVVSISEEA